MLCCVVINIMSPVVESRLSAALLAPEKAVIVEEAEQVQNF